MTKLYITIFIILVIAGCRSDSGITAPDDGLPPAVPSGLRITFANDGEIVIRWNRNTEADFNFYTVYRSLDNEEYVPIDSLFEEYFLDDSLEYDQIYYYRISATDNSLRESELSAEVSAVPENVYPPDKPDGLVINARNLQGSLSVFLKWLPGYESDITGYNIYRSDTEIFETDSLNLIGFTSVNNYTDTNYLELYKQYYYIIRGVDKGGLTGIESDRVNDLILGMPSIVYPPDNSFVDPFLHLVINTIDVPAEYKIIVQTNEFFGEFWNRNVYSEKTNDTLMILFNPDFLQRNKTYYWRVAAYSSGQDPNSVSPLFNFTIKP